MVTVVNRPQHWTEALSTGLGSGLSRSLEQLAQKKALGALGISPEQAQGLAGLNPQVQSIALKQMLQQPQNQAFAQALSGMLGGSTPKNEQMGQVPPQLNSQQALQLAQLGMQRESNEIKRQQAIEKSNAPYIKEIKDQSVPAKELDQILDDTLNLLNTGKIQTGPLKSLIPDRLQNQETQAFVSNLNEIVTRKAQLGKGVPSRQRLLLEQLAKAQTWQKPEAIKYILNRLKRGTLESLVTENIADQIIQENNGMQPKGLENIVKQRIAKTKGLPSPLQYSEDAIIEANGKRFARSGNTWLPLE